MSTEDYRIDRKKSFSKVLFFNLLSILGILFVLDCNLQDSKSSSNACDFSTKPFRSTYLAKLILGDISPYCGIQLFNIPWVLGQTDERDVVQNHLAVEFPLKIRFCGNNIAIIDSSFIGGQNNRILIYDAPLGESFRRPKIILGADNVSTKSHVPVSAGTVNSLFIRLRRPTQAYSLDAPSDIACTENRLAVVDRTGNRVLLWNRFPTSNNQVPDLVLGQDNLTSYGLNKDTLPLTPTASSMNGPRAVAFTETGIVVADTENNRILIWNSFPTVNGQNADVVIGQNTFTCSLANATAVCSGAGPTQSSLSRPFALKYKNRELWVMDSVNSRVLKYNTLPTANYALADLVVGQSNFTTNTPGIFIPSGIGIYSEIELTSTSLLVTHPGGNRVIVFSPIPTTNGQPVTSVLGQTNLTNIGAVNENAFFESSLTFPTGLEMNGNSLYVAENTAGRIVRFEGPSFTTFQKGVSTFGQRTQFDKYRNLNPPSRFHFSNPNNIFFSEDQTFVTDTGFSRIVVYPKIPETSREAPSFVIGQRDFDSDCVGLANIEIGQRFSFKNPCTGTQTGLSSNLNLISPRKGLVYKNKLLVLDQGANRILVWNSVPKTFLAPADNVIGQTNFSGVGFNLNGSFLPTQNSLRNPFDMTIAGDSLYVLDAGGGAGTITCNCRVLRFDLLNLSNGMNANLVLGQSNFTTGGADAGTPGSPSNLGIQLNSTGIAASDSRIYVADRANNRVIGWSTIPTTNGAPADILLGKSSFTNIALSDLSTDFVSPLSLFWDTKNDRLFVSDLNGRRILYYNSASTLRSGARPNGIIGQKDLNSNENDFGGFTSTSFNQAASMTIQGDFFYITDVINHRIIRLKLRPDGIPQIAIPL